MMPLPTWLTGEQPPPDAWNQLNAWLWARHLLKHSVPREIFDAGDDVVAETVKLVDVAIRDCVRRIHRALLEQGTPAIEAFVAVEQAELARHRKQDAKMEKAMGELRKQIKDMFKPKPMPPMLRVTRQMYDRGQPPKKL